MNYLFNGDEINQRTILGHPSGLFTLFFTEMWERFSYYGMRAILVLFLVSSMADQGWGWERADALKLYAWYTGLVYITPIFGGIIADKFLGYRKAVIIGALLMTLGHASMALEVFYDFYLYFGLAGIFMFFGMLQFHYGQNIFGNIGLHKKTLIDKENIDIESAPVSKKVIRDRLLVIGIFSFVTIFFWWGFEQSGGSMTIFANDYTNRDLVGTGALIFKIINTLLTVVPMIILTIILFMLFKNTFSKYMISNLFLGTSFLIIWGILI